MKKLILLIAVTVGLGACSTTTETGTSVDQPLAYDPDRCWNTVIDQDGEYFWPNGCEGDPSLDMCTEALVRLDESEVSEYQAWQAAGEPVLAACQ